MQEASDCRKRLKYTDLFFLVILKVLSFFQRNRCILAKAMLVSIIFFDEVRTSTAEVFKRLLKRLKNNKQEPPILLKLQQLYYHAFFFDLRISHVALEIY